MRTHLKRSFIAPDLRVNSASVLLLGAEPKSRHGAGAEIYGSGTYIFTAALYLLSVGHKWYLYFHSCAISLYSGTGVIHIFLQLGYILLYWDGSGAYPFTPALYLFTVGRE